MPMRQVTPERLDTLPADDAQALRARADLQRIHLAMGTRDILVKALSDMPRPGPRDRPWRVLELGAGDGTLMLRVARSLAGRWPGTDLTLLDRLPLVRPDMAADYAAVGWRLRTRVVDVLDWAGEAADTAGPSGAPGRWDLIVCNLFLHHFESPQLRVLLRVIAQRCDRFFACEPRRGRAGWIGSRLVAALGANAVTRTDAVLSVRAGFRGKELAELWPAADGQWNLQTYPSGLFSHCFRAERLVPHP